ncbi:MAG: class F sortase [Dehalococcoidia bacterium]
MIQRRRLRRSLLLTLSALILAAGFALVALFAVGSLSGSSSDAEPPSVYRFVAEPEHVFDQPVVTPRPSPSPTPAPPPTEPPLGDAPFRLVIPDIGVDAPVNAYGLDAQNVPQVPLNGQEVAWYNWSARPGMGSNAVFAGHVTWSGVGVFYNLDDLEAGDKIVLRADDGTQLDYTVESNVLVDPHDPNALSVMSPTDADSITVITCGGTFFSTGDAIFGGDYTNRRVVRARLAVASPAAEPAVAGR